jgi:F-type H+-transporting ATPase subunit b
MLIDWFTVVAQIVNFLVLVALMKRFLYGPLVRAIDAREKGIETSLATAEEKNRLAANSMAEAKALQSDLEQKRDQILAAAREDADRRRGEMLQKARDSVKELETRWRDEMERERAVFLAEIRSRAASEILAITRRALADLAGADVERCAIQTFLARLRNLKPEALQSLCAGELTVATPAELPADTQREIARAIDDRLGGPVPLRFESVPAMAWGIELRGGGQRIGWTPDSYLDTLEANLNEALDRGITIACPVAA